MASNESAFSEALLELKGLLILVLKSQRERDQALGETVSQIEHSLIDLKNRLERLESQQNPTTILTTIPTQES